MSPHRHVHQIVSKFLGGFSISPSGFPAHKMARLPSPFKKLFFILTASQRANLRGLCCTRSLRLGLPHILVGIFLAETILKHQLLNDFASGHSHTFEDINRSCDTLFHTVIIDAFAVIAHSLKLPFQAIGHFDVILGFELLDFFFNRYAIGSATSNIPTTFSLLVGLPSRQRSVTCILS